MTGISLHKIDTHRRLCIQKDLGELNTWHTLLECFNKELDHITIIEKQLIKTASLLNLIQAIRRKNILMMADLCKYEQELKSEYEYGKVDYDLKRLKVHEHKRTCYLKLIGECHAFKNQFYMSLRMYRRK
ncbi:hypothetical protein [Confluentibacter sediminis]|uniref:hypothetical protein n=1 Tax=Confluentibacter sediminis TaxID=2219045 RepID=UPI000DAD81FA|nr:hypothetical protein [Confluentibacter sediminis]